LAPPLVWGVRALSGLHLKHAMWRAFAWPLGAVLTSAGLGIMPAFKSLSAHVGQVYGQGWIAIALPLLLLVAGLPLSFLATGLKLTPILRAIVNVPAAALWLGSLIKMPEFSFRRARDYDEEDHEPAFDDDFEHEDDAYALDVAPEPIAATRLAERRESRIKREEAKKALATGKRGRQPALDLVSGEYQLPAL